MLAPSVGLGLGTGQRGGQQRDARVTQEHEVRVVEIVGVTGGAVGERGPGGRGAQRRADDRAERRATLGTDDGADGDRRRLGGAGEHHAQRVERRPAHLGDGGVGAIGQRGLDDELGHTGGRAHGRTIAEGMDGCKAPGAA